MRLPDLNIPEETQLATAHAYAHSFGGASEEETVIQRANRLARAKSRATVEGAGLAETYYLARFEDAGVATRWDSELGQVMVPGWACVFIEAAFAAGAFVTLTETNIHARRDVLRQYQVDVLKRALQDEAFRAAGLTVWRFSGVDAVGVWLVKEIPG